MDTIVENLTQPLLESLSEDEDKQFINHALDDGKHANSLISLTL